MKEEKELPEWLREIIFKVECNEELRVEIRQFQREQRAKEYYKKNGITPTKWVPFKTNKKLI